MRSLLLAALTADWMWRKRHFSSVRRRDPLRPRAAAPLKIFAHERARVALADDQRRPRVPVLRHRALRSRQGRTTGAPDGRARVLAPAIKAAEHDQQRPYPPHPNGNVHHLGAPPTVTPRAPPARSPPSCWRCSSFPPPRRRRRACSTSSTATARSRSTRARTRSRSTATTSRARSARAGSSASAPTSSYTNGKIPGVDVLHLHHARLAHQRAPDVRGRRGEDERQAAAAVRLAPPARRPLGAQPHGPQPAAEPRPRLPHLHDRLHPRLVAAREADAAGRRRAGSTSRAAAPIRSSTCTGAAAANGRFTFPRRRAERLRRRVRAQPAAHPARRRAGADGRATCTPAACTRT